MESGSGSLQSSSAGDEDYDSHHLFPHAPPPLFFNTTTPPLPPPPQHQLPSHLPPHHNFHTPFLFDFPSTNFNPNPTSLRSTPNPLHPKPASTKKRTRASRRAPTTILTTDTTNFRAMVQEFTGIPSPPFTATASSSSSRRFDLFSSVSTSRPKVQLFSSFNNNTNNNNNNVSTEDQNASHLQGIFPLQSVSEIRLDSPHIYFVTDSTAK